MYRRLSIAGILLVVATAGYAQTSDEKPVCTDLSGKIRVECPHAQDSTADTAVVPRTANSAQPASVNSAPHAAPARKSPWVRVAEHSGTADAATPAAGPIVVRNEAAAPRRKSLEASLPENFIADQRNFWTSPLKLRFEDASWLLPVAGLFAVTTLSDVDIERELPTDPNFIRRSKTFSDYGAAAYAGMVGGAYLLGRATHNDHMRETAVLSGEAAVNTLLVGEAAKYLAGRSRPLEGDGTGPFRSGGSSFPSMHAAAAFSIATVVAHEYPGHLTGLLAYGSAAAIAAARVTGRQHFASDVLVGSALGWFIGRQVYGAHSDSEDRARFGDFMRAPREHGPADPANMGSSYVALDSWIYPAIDRLAAEGYIDTSFQGMRPWTRMECARMVQEAGDKIAVQPDTNAEVRQFYGALTAEFATENRRWAGDRNLGAELESVYTRVTGISGRPLNDSYHFGQTIINDYGRPYQQGFNMVTGFTSHAEAGPLTFYVSGEYQHSPSAPGYPLDVRQAIATMDDNPLQPSLPFAAHNDFQLLDSYAALTIKNNQFSFGRQSLWWGPGQNGALMFTNNAVPVNMLRWTQASPIKLPSFLGFLGPMRMDMFIGKLAGHHYPAAPYISAQKVSFKPTPNLEFGFSKITVFAGGGIPLSWHNYVKATFDMRSPPVGDYNLPGLDPGDRRGGFDFSYRLPGLRKWLTLYTDSLVDDDPSPLAAPRRAAMNPGIYLSHFPGLPKLDFRAEGVYTDTPTSRSNKGQFIYWNTVYHDSHTNMGNVMGDWIGREGKGWQLQSTYWFSPKNTVVLGYRGSQLASDLLPGGGRSNDFSARTNWVIRRNFLVGMSLQYEQWKLPLLSPTAQSNFTTSFQFTFLPHWSFR